jgi:hypothetical protein
MSHAVSSALSGLAASRAWMDAAAQTTARAGLPGADAGADLVDGVVGTTMAATAVAVDVAVLRSALDSEHALLDILA